MAARSDHHRADRLLSALSGTAVQLDSRDSTFGKHPGPGPDQPEHSVDPPLPVPGHAQYLQAIDRATARHTRIKITQQTRPRVYCIVADTDHAAVFCFCWFYHELN